jgi:cytochrome c biogenesis protein CcdA/thiol-disulfide isomerase/thioredoxin
MELLVLFAFLAGVVTIISPCVLPVLPVLLSTSSAGGRLRPVGIILGLAITFTTVTLAVAAAAQALALPAAWLRIIAIVALGFFGLALLVPPLGRWMERVLSPLTRLAESRPERSGFWGGTAIGAGLGLLWAPCVGPIMASVLGLTALAGVTPAAIAITLSYSLGAAVPMLLIGYGGRRLVSRARRLGRTSTVVRQVFGGLTVVACVALLLGADARLRDFAVASLPAGWNQALVNIERGDSIQSQIVELQNQASSGDNTKEMDAMSAPMEPTAEPTAQAAEPMASAPTEPPMTPTAPAEMSQPKVALQDLGPAPEMTGIALWFNSEPLTLKELHGKVVIVDFWTFDCINCRNTMPYVKDLYAKYHSQGLEIVGVHTPELSFEYVPENVKAAIKDQGITWPVAFDPNYKTWNAYNNMYWPAFYFVDANGRVRYTHFGEGNYDYNEKVVQQLLSEVRN